MDVPTGVIICQQHRSGPFMGHPSESELLLSWSFHSKGLGLCACLGALPGDSEPLFLPPEGTGSKIIVMCMKAQKSTVTKCNLYPLGHRFPFSGQNSSVQARKSDLESRRQAC